MFQLHPAVRDRAEWSRWSQGDDDIEVSGNYRLSQKADFNIFHRAKLTGNGYKVEFEKNLIKEGKVIRQGNDVIFKDLPKEELDKQFEL